MHLILKYNDSVYSVNTIEEHKKLLRKNRFVVWGVIKPKADSPGISKDKINQLNHQISSGVETYAYLATGGHIKARAKVVEILTNEAVQKMTDFIPEYYRKNIDKCIAGVKLETIENVESDIINNLQRYGTEGGNIALGNQTNPLYVSLKKTAADNNNVHDIPFINEAGNDTFSLEEDQLKDYLNDITNYINSIGFIYNPEDIYNLFLSLKTKPFVILAGISGTGKSKIVRLFAEAVGANVGNGRFKMISVKPDWNDSAELFGYYNINDEYVPGLLTEFISSAKKNKNLPYFVCIDEMNLARVEYYFSEYLSLIESRRRENDEIITDNISIGTKPSDLYLPENLYVVGTVNMDDTTFSFSRKVLDRANTIEFADVDLSKIFLENEYIDDTGNLTLHNKLLKSTYINIHEIEEEHRDFATKINNKLLEINGILQKGKKHFAYRVRDEIIYYMVENKKLELLDEKEAFDFQILQKILPLINGSEAVIKEILIELFKKCMEKKVALAENDFLEEAQANLEYAIYKRSARKIVDMLRGYKYDGFSTFWY